MEDTPSFPAGPAACMLVEPLLAVAAPVGNRRIGHFWIEAVKNVPDVDVRTLEEHKEAAAF
jgi:hypothetical protein